MTKRKIITNDDCSFKDLSQFYELSTEDVRNLIVKRVGIKLWGRCVNNIPEDEKTLKLVKDSEISEKLGYQFTMISWFNENRLEGNTSSSMIFRILDRYFRLDAYFDSYEGMNLDEKQILDFYQVSLTQKIILTFERVQ